MREYGQVQSAFWQSADAQGMSDAGKLLSVYLLTGPHTNGLGCFKVPDGYVMADLGWDIEMVSKGFQELFEKGFCKRLDGVVFLPNFLRWNRIANGNIAKARFGEFDQLPKGDAKTLAARAMLEFCEHWTGPQLNELETLCQTLSKGYANQNPTRPNPERKEKTLSSGDDDPAQKVDPPQTDPVPYPDIVAAYHEHLPTLPQVRKLSDTRRRKLRARWREDAERQSLDYWRDFFTYVAQSDFLTGRNGQWQGCDFEWLLEASNHLKVTEGKYENRSAA